MILLCLYHVPGTVLGAEDSIVNKTLSLFGATLSRGIVFCLGLSVDRKNQNVCDLGVIKPERILTDDENQQQFEKWIMMPQHALWIRNWVSSTFDWLDWFTYLTLGLNYNSWASNAFSCFSSLCSSNTWSEGGSLRWAERLCDLPSSHSCWEISWD